MIAYLFIDILKASTAVFTTFKNQDCLKITPKVDYRKLVKWKTREIYGHFKDDRIEYDGTTSITLQYPKKLTFKKDKSFLNIFVPLGGFDKSESCIYVITLEFVGYNEKHYFIDTDPFFYDFKSCRWQHLDKKNAKKFE